MGLIMETIKVFSKGGKKKLQDHKGTQGATPGLPLSTADIEVQRCKQEDEGLPLAHQLQGPSTPTSRYPFLVLLTSLSLISITSVSAWARLHGLRRRRTPHKGFQRNSSQGIPASIQTAA